MRSAPHSIGLFVLVSASAWAQDATTTRVSVDSSGFQGFGVSNAASISGDGRYVAFQSSVNVLVTNDTNGAQDVFRHDRQTGLTVRASVDSAGIEGNHASLAPSISSDGRYVAFYSYASNLVANDANGKPDVFRHDFQTGLTERASVDSNGGESNDVSYSPSISADGRFVAFESSADNLVLNDTNLGSDVFRHDFQTGLTERVSVDSGGGESSGHSYAPSISADGRYVAFMSSADDLVPNDTNLTFDVFRRDLQAGVTERASVHTGGEEANLICLAPSISGDGRFVAFYSLADNLVADDANLDFDVFRHDFQTGVTDCASVDSTGVPGNDGSFSPSISGDGRFVAFHSLADDLVLDDDTSIQDVFRRDFLTGYTERSSVDTFGAAANHNSQYPSISANGRLVAFSSLATNLVGGDWNGSEDVFVRDTGSFVITPICFGDGSGALCPCKLGEAGRGCENSASTGGALLEGIGEAYLTADTLQLAASHERPTALTVFWQGQEGPPNLIGDGLGCVGGPIKRLYYRSAVGGAVMAPQGADPSITARSAAMGIPIGPGDQLVYQTFYRDNDSNYCPHPFGSNFNTSNGLRVTWRP